MNHDADAVPLSRRIRRLALAGEPIDDLLAERWGLHIAAARAQYDERHAAGDPNYQRHDACVHEEVIAP